MRISLLVFYFFSVSLSFSQPIIEIKEIDEFTGKRHIETSFIELNWRCAYKLRLIDSTLFMDVQFFDNPVFITSENPFYLKMDDDTILKIFSNNGSSIAFGVNEDIGFLGRKIAAKATYYFPLELISKLTSRYILKFRIQGNNGYEDHDIKHKMAINSVLAFRLIRNNLNWKP